MRAESSVFAVLMGAAAIALCVADVRAADTAFYLGTWTVKSGTPAPWVVSDDEVDPNEVKSFVGKTLAFEAARITAPGLLACPDPTYGIVEVPPEGLFQGGLDEMERADRGNAAELAVELGFQIGPIRTLQTGCANELDFHFVDDRTGKFALDNVIYTIVKK